MTQEQEQTLIDLQRHSALHDARISNLETKFEMFMQSMKETTDNLKAEMQDFKNEMRDRDNRRADEIATVNAKYDAEVKAINAKIDEKFEKILSQMQNMAIAAVVGVGAIVVGVVSIMKP